MAVDYSESPWEQYEAPRAPKNALEGHGRPVGLSGEHWEVSRLYLEDPRVP